MLVITNYSPFFEYMTFRTSKLVYFEIFERVPGKAIVFFSTPLRSGQTCLYTNNIGKPLNIILNKSIHSSFQLA